MKGNWWTEATYPQGFPLVLNNYPVLERHALDLL